MMQNKIKIIFILLIQFLLNGCVGSNPPISCKQLSHDYAKYDSIKSITLNTAKGYKGLSKYLFIYDMTNQFNEDIDTYFLYLELFKKKSINNFYLNDYCHNINNTLKDENRTKVLHSLKNLKELWTEEYNEKIQKNLQNKIDFNIIDGCEDYALNLVKYIYTFRTEWGESNNTIYSEMKNMYTSCLSFYTKKAVQ